VVFSHYHIATHLFFYKEQYEIQIKKMEAQLRREKREFMELEGK
jgi:predicted metallo-beta-lactamase superfamily hydrolase